MYNFKIYGGVAKNPKLKIHTRLLNSITHSVAMITEIIMGEAEDHRVMGHTSGPED